MIDIKFINATSIQLKDQNDNVVTTIGEFSGSPIEFTYSGDTFSKSPANFYHFVIEGSNVLLSGTIGTVTEAYQYWNLFKGQSAITNASDLTLSSIVAKQFCYANMFLNCTNLTDSPTISATTLDLWCYSSMFGGCTSLTSAPTLVATTLAPYCYYAMFYSCKALTISPYLPASTLVDWCYNSMFYNCLSLTSISASFSDWNTSGNSTKNWVTGIETVGDFYNDNVEIEYSVDGVPLNWKPDYSAMPLTFKGKAATNAVQLNQTGSPNTINLQYSKNNGPWTTYIVGNVIELNLNETVTLSGNNSSFNIDYYNYYRFQMTGTIEAKGNIQSLMNYSNRATNYCYWGLFRDCTSLKKAPLLLANTLADNCYIGMFNGCTNLIKSPSILPATTMASGCYKQMFYNCTSLSTVPSTLLPATTLARECYDGMFYGCNKLTDAPLLPATTLTTHCYLAMFMACSSLSSINVSFTSWGSDNGAQNWVQYVAANGTFVKPALLSEAYGTSRIPLNWTVINK